MVGIGAFTVADVDANYQLIINSTSGTLDTAGAKQIHNVGSDTVVLATQGGLLGARRFTGFIPLVDRYLRPGYDTSKQRLGYEYVTLWAKRATSVHCTVRRTIYITANEPRFEPVHC